MRIFKKIFDSIAGKPVGPQNPILTEVVVGTTEQLPPVIFQPMPNPQLQDQDTDNFLEEVVEAFDSAFEAVCSSNTSRNSQISETKQDEHVEAVVLDLFVQIAANYAIPLKNFIFELRRGTATKEEIEFCRPILYSIRNAAETMNLTRAVQQISEVDKVLASGQNGSHWLLQGELRQQILSSYEALAEVLPEAFQPGDEEQKRENIIIRSLLQQISGLGCVTLERLYRSGLGSLESLFLANKEDLAVATGIPSRMCELICEKVAQHRKEIETMPRDAAKSGWRSQLVEMVNRLRNDIEVEMPRACPENAPASEKQRCRHQRQMLFLEITVILAEMGELNLLNRIHRLSFKRRLQTLDGYLAETKATVSNVTQ